MFETTKLFDAPPLTPEELAAIDRGIEAGWLLASGHRLIVLTEFRARCERAGRKAITARVGARVGTVESNGRTIWRGRVDDAPDAARRIVGDLAKGGTVEAAHEQGRLFQ